MDRMADDYMTSHDARVHPNTPPDEAGALALPNDIILHDAQGAMKLHVVFNLYSSAELDWAGRSWTKQAEPEDLVSGHAVVALEPPMPENEFDARYSIVDFPQCCCCPEEAVSQV